MIAPACLNGKPCDVHRLLPRALETELFAPIAVTVARKVDYRLAILPVGSYSGRKTNPPAV